VIRRFLASAILGVFVLAGCHSGQRSASHSSADAGLKVYHLRGTVVSADPSSGILVVNGDEIPGFMKAMTMPYELKNPAVANTLHAGDTITADVVVSKTSAHTVVLDKIQVVSRAKPDQKPKPKSKSS